MLPDDLILAGCAKIVVAGGMEFMSNAPYLLKKARAGYRVGHDRVFDHMMLDGLEDAYEPGRAMGEFGEAAAPAYQFTRADQDTYAPESLTRAREAIESGAFTAEIAPLPVPAKARADGRRTSTRSRCRPEDPGLRPAFRPDGTITAASASANADGAAALVLTRRSLAEREGLPVLAEIKGHATYSQEPAVHHRSNSGDPQGAGQGRLACGRRRPVRDQRGVCRRRHGGRPRPRHPARQAQRPRRRLRTRAIRSAPPARELS